MDEKKQATERRTLLETILKSALIIGVLGLAGAVLTYLFPPKRRISSATQRRMRVARVDEIPLGKGKQVLFAGEPVWVLHLKSGWIALSAVCTHQGCIVQWDEKRLTLNCPCHAGLFDANGNVLAGPPRRPLKRLRVFVIRDEIFLGSSEEEA